MLFFTLFLIPMIVAAGGYYFLRGVTFKEFLLQLAAQAVVVGIFLAIVYHSNVADGEKLHGIVTRKAQDEVHCQHSYECHCRNSCSGTGKNRSCHRVCDTCYEHRHDYDWNVYSSIDYHSTISRVDRQGLIEPPRWTAAVVGEPYTVEHSYDNYIKAAPGTLLRHQGLTEKYQRYLVGLPKDVYDYYRTNSLVLLNGARVPSGWDRDLEVLNSHLGPIKQSDVYVVLVKDLPQEFFYALEQHVLGGPKNAVTVVVGVDAAMTPQWATAMAWTSNEMFKVQMRDQIMALPTITREALLPVIAKVTGAYFVRKPMHDFEYLKASIVPTSGQMTAGVIIGLIVAFVLLYYLNQYDVFGDEGRQHFTYSKPRYRRSR